MATVYTNFFIFVSDRSRNVGIFFGNELVELKTQSLPKVFLGRR